MKKLSKITARSITGKTSEEVAKSTDAALRQVWASLNGIIDTLNNMTEGSPGLESNAKNIRLVQTKDEYHLEGRFKDGWARLGTSTTLLTKKD